MRHFSECLATESWIFSSMDNCRREDPIFLVAQLVDCLDSECVKYRVPLQAEVKMCSKKQSRNGLFLYSKGVVLSNTGVNNQIIPVLCCINCWSRAFICYWFYLCIGVKCFWHTVVKEPDWQVCRRDVKLEFYVCCFLLEIRNLVCVCNSNWMHYPTIKCGWGYSQ